MLVLCRPTTLRQLLLRLPLTPVRNSHCTLATMAQEYKLKGLTTLDLPAGFKQEAEVEGIEGAKVLVVSAAGKVSAIGAKCTHYGAPLVKGVLTADGRVTCPWHGGTSPLKSHQN